MDNKVLTPNTKHHDGKLLVEMSYITSLKDKKAKKPVRYWSLPATKSRNIFSNFFEFLIGKKGRNRLRSSKYYVLKEIVDWLHDILGMKVSWNNFF